MQKTSFGPNKWGPIYHWNVYFLISHLPEGSLPVDVKISFVLFF